MQAYKKSAHRIPLKFRCSIVAAANYFPGAYKNVLKAEFLCLRPIILLSRPFNGPVVPFCINTHNTARTLNSTCFSSSHALVPRIYSPVCLCSPDLFSLSPSLPLHRRAGDMRSHERGKWSPRPGSGAYSPSLPVRLWLLPFSLSVFVRFTARIKSDSIYAISREGKKARARVCARATVCAPAKKWEKTTLFRTSVCTLCVRVCVCVRKGAGRVYRGQPACEEERRNIERSLVFRRQSLPLRRWLARVARPVTFQRDQVCTVYCWGVREERETQKLALAAPSSRTSVHTLLQSVAPNTRYIARRKLISFARCIYSFYLNSQNIYNAKYTHN